MITQTLPIIQDTIKDASSAFRTLQGNPEVSALLGPKYEGLEWSATEMLAAARELALRQGILPDPWGVLDFMEELKSAADLAYNSIFQPAWQ